MPDFSLIGGSPSALESGYDFTSTTGTALTTGGTDTKGSYVELLSAANNTYASDKLMISISRLGGAGTDALTLTDIAIGGAGSEVVICPNLLGRINSDGYGLVHFVYDFPVHIPAGVRISARVQTSGSSGTSDVHIIRVRQALSQQSPLSKILAIGDDTATTSGVTVARTTANTFGSWVEITASLSESIKGFIVSGIKDFYSWQIAKITFQVGVGSAGNEEVIYSGGHIATDTQEKGQGAISSFIPIGIAAGERISIRAQSNIADADCDLDYIIYGVR